MVKQKDETKQFHLPTQEFIIPYTIFLKKIGTDVDESFVDESKVIEQLIAWDKKNIGLENPEAILLVINCNGGIAYDMMSIIDVMRSIETPVITYCAGTAMSAAATILACGDYRYISRHSTVMMHNITTSVEGKVSEVKSEFKHNEHLEKMQVEIIAKATGKSIRTIKALLSKTVYFTANQAQKYGIVDKIIDQVPYKIPDDIKQIIKKKKNSK